MHDPREIAAQINDDGVAFVDLPDDPALQDQLIDALGERDGFIVAPSGANDLRDLGQDVLDSSDADTIIVRSPESAAVVSDEHSRAAIESAQGHLFTEPDYVEGARGFLDDVAGFGMTWWMLTAAIAIAIVIVALWTLRSVRS